jgi:hypothetical protein
LLLGSARLFNSGMVVDRSWIPLDDRQESAEQPLFVGRVQ